MNHNFSLINICKMFVRLTLRTTTRWSRCIQIVLPRQLPTLDKVLTWWESATTWWKTCNKNNKQTHKISKTRLNKEKVKKLNQTNLAQRIMLIIIGILSWISLIVMILDSWMLIQMMNVKRKSIFITRKALLVRMSSLQSVLFNLDKVKLITMITI